MTTDPVTTELKVARIGNSRGVRIPAQALARYGIGSVVRMEEHPEGILLRPVLSGATKLSWRDTAKAMAAAHEDWGAWDAAAGDGLSDLPWDAEPAQTRRRKARPSTQGQGSARRRR